MANTIDCLNIPDGWSKAYIAQLASYVSMRDHEGWYTGNKQQFEKRHKEILEWIEEYEEKVYQEDAPKFRRKNAKH